MIEIIPLPAFQDNYIWAITSVQSPWCIVVDPGDATIVEHFLHKTNKRLLAVLITHHHADHTGGIQALKQQWPTIRVIGPAAEAHRIPTLTEQVAELDTLTFAEMALNFHVLAIPGHTAGHIAFYSAPVLFCGDTLFSGGCGRLLEGTFDESAISMYQSLERLASLPDDTAVYCTHEYTLANLRFAHTVEPTNQALASYRQLCEVKRQNAMATLPSSIGLEKKINPFLRCENKDLQLKFKQNTAQALFACLRKAKDQFKS